MCPGWTVGLLKLPFEPPVRDRPMWEYSTHEAVDVYSYQEDEKERSRSRISACEQYVDVERTQA